MEGEDVGELLLHQLDEEDEQRRVLVVCLRVAELRENSLNLTDSESNAQRNVALCCKNDDCLHASAT